MINPKAKVLNKKKEPDLKLTDADSGEELFVEITSLKPSKGALDAERTSLGIIDCLWSFAPFIHYCGRIYKALSRRHLECVVKEIREIAERAERENSFQELIIEDVIEIGVAPESDKQKLEKWAAERKLNVGELLGPPFDVNEIVRTRRAIEREQRQLPRDYPNVLVVENNHLFLTIRDVRKSINELEEEVYEYPHLLLGVIAGEHLGREENITLMKDQHVFIKKVTDDVFTELYIILLNRFSDHKIRPKTITKLYSAFRS